MTTPGTPATSELLRGAAVRGHPERVNSAVRALAAVGSEMRDYRGTMRQVRTRLRLLDALVTMQIDAKLCDQLIPGSERLLESVEQAERATRRYADELRWIHREAARITASLDATLSEIRTHMRRVAVIADAIAVPMRNPWDLPVPATMPEPQTAAGQLVTQLSWLPADRWRAVLEHEWRSAALCWARELEQVTGLRRAWQRLREQRREAERVLGHALAVTPLGVLLRFAASGHESRDAAVAFGIAGELHGVRGGLGPLTLSHPLLTSLLGAGYRGDLWSQPPSPLSVAQAWQRLSAAQQEQLIREVPRVIGNLPGLPFEVRDRANRIVLDFYGRNLALLGERSAQLVRALQNLEATDDPPTMRVVALELSGEVPKLVLGYGELDRAENLTWQVPGMQSDADEALQQWDAASRALYEEQAALIEEGAPVTSTGVLAFLGYDSPDLADSGNLDGVLSPDLARRGAVRLAAELDGSWAARNAPLGVAPGYRAPESPIIGVVAHSYGTTVAANALTMTRVEVDTCTLVASAGLDHALVDRLDALRIVTPGVGPRQLYVAQARGDSLAALGVTLSGRANPNAALAFSGVPNLRGALHFDVEGYRTPNGQSFAGTDGHSVIGVPTGGLFDAHRYLTALGFEASQGHGYWDRGTQSLRNIAAAALGLQDRIVGGTRAG